MQSHTTRGEIFESVANFDFWYHILDILIFMNVFVVAQRHHMDYGLEMSMELKNVYISSI